MHAKEPSPKPAPATTQVRRPESPRQSTPGPVGPGEVESLQRSIGNTAVTRLIAAQRAEAEPEPPVQRSTAHQVLASSGKPMDTALRGEMESRLGADFSDVRVHTGAAAQRSAAELGARAYTSGANVVLGRGGGDKHTLAHELTHVIQQRQGPVAGTDNGSGLSVSDPGDRFERAAEANARRAMSGPAHDPHEGHDHG
ncbi:MULTISPECIES: eCIS core domain-containing protein [Actinosynnema]|uniref:eCIS core domain-containing protein n=1 Tax=Actinosynnema pretiosum TaxID=42197 RepID=A0A290Z336_9PSEU|nr:DUF4157 domain-containing protein [Actinosynnema pretiosum]ATE53379.1 hypothetical protein CNX65_08825 [Actinosynnema pretiosum]